MFSVVKSGLPKFLLPLFIVVSTVSMAGCDMKAHLPWIPANQQTTNVVSVFFSKYQGSQAIVEPVKRELPKEAQNERLTFAINELLKGPSSEERGQGFYTEIPKDTQLLGIKEQGNTVTIDLSKPFEAGGGSNSMTQRLEELKHTTYAVDSKHQLSVTVDGKPLNTLGGEGLEVPGTLQREHQ